MESAGQMAVPPPGGLGGAIGIALVSLGLVCLVAYLALRWLSRQGVGRGGGQGAIRVMARCPLEPRRSLYLVEAAGRCFLVGVGDGPMTMLADLGVLEPSALGNGIAAPPGASHGGRRGAGLLDRLGEAVQAARTNRSKAPPPPPEVGAP